MLEEEYFAGEFNGIRKEDFKNFETGRIKALQEERLYIQKKTFTKWMNSFLLKVRMEVEDIFTDLSDGRKLLRLLEIISGEKLGKPNSGRMRVHRVENVNRSLAFLHTKVRLESIGAEDIVDGNQRLILGLIWTIILRFQIEVIDINLEEEDGSSEKTSARDALLLWCQRTTAGHKGVCIQDFSSSWRNGLAFNALVHVYRPDLVDYDSLDPSDHLGNLNRAFDVAHKELGIHKLLDAEDMDVSRPDEKSVMTYVASYYHMFAKMKSEIRGGKRIAHIVGQMMNVDSSKERYNGLVTSLLNWINLKIIELEERNFPNHLDAVQGLLLSFKTYRTKEKPAKFQERSDVEALFFDINTKLKSLSKAMFQPSDGLSLADVERRWTSLEKSEHNLELALRDELQRQQRLVQIACKFDRKSTLRNGYLEEMIQVLSDPRYGSNVVQVDATMKKHEAISADIMAREDRFADLIDMADSLENERYYDASRIRLKEQEITNKWKHLLQLLDKHKGDLLVVSRLMSLLRDVESVSQTVHDLDSKMRTLSAPSHLLAAEDLIQKHLLMESQVSGIGDSVDRVNKQSANVLQTTSIKEASTLQKRVEVLNDEYKNLKDAGVLRREHLDDVHSYLHFMQDCDDEENWLMEKKRMCETVIVAKDLRAVATLQQKHRVLEDEMRSRRLKLDKTLRPGEQMVSQSHQNASEIAERINALKKLYSQLEESSLNRRKELASTAEAYGFYSDANEAESWIKEKMSLVKSSDCGSDEPAASALLSRHRDTMGQIDAYSTDIASLKSQADKLDEMGITSLNLTSNENTQVNEWVQETRLVPEEYWEDETVERTEFKVVTVQREVPQVQALYPFKGHDMDVSKGEVMLLVNRTNNDWWNVRTNNGRDGFVPANYVRDVAPKTVAVKIKQPEKIVETRRVRKSRMVRQTTPIKVARPCLEKNEEIIAQRIKSVATLYDQLKQFSGQREIVLKDSIDLFKLICECNDLISFLHDKEKFLNDTDEKTANAAKQSFDAFLTDMSSAARRVEAIDACVKRFVERKSDSVVEAKERQMQVHKIWDHITRLRQKKERNLEGAFSVELFTHTCDEVCEWITDKKERLDGEQTGPNLQVIQALQRRHENFERELIPVEEKVHRVLALASSVKSSYPHETTSVNERQKRVHDMWLVLKRNTEQRHATLQQSADVFAFMDRAHYLLAWAREKVVELKTFAISVPDLQTVDVFVKNHRDVGEEIRSHEDEFDALEDMSIKLMGLKLPCKETINDISSQLATQHGVLNREWKNKDVYLGQLKASLMINREADQLDAIHSVNQGVLDSDTVGDTLDTVERQLKRQEELENRMAAQEDRISTFNKMTDELLSSDHYDSEVISSRRQTVMSRRDALKRMVAERRHQLLAAQHFFEFLNDCDEMMMWMSDKSSLVAERDTVDNANLQRKLRKHEAFQRELRSNEARLKRLSKMGGEFISGKHHRAQDVSTTLQRLMDKWDELQKLTLTRGTHIKQAALLYEHGRSLDTLECKFEELKRISVVNETPGDLRRCKQLLTRHHNHKTELEVLHSRVAELEQAVQESSHIGPSPMHDLSRQCLTLRENIVSLRNPFEVKHTQILEALKSHEFLSVVTVELQWIEERKPFAESHQLATTLPDAQKLLKKHTNIVDELKGHRLVVDKVLVQGAELIQRDGDVLVNRIAQMCQQLRTGWSNLDDVVQVRSDRLQLNLSGQRFLSDADELETWLSERIGVFEGGQLGTNESTIIKLLTKHKAMELEVDTYSGLVNELMAMADMMLKNDHPDSRAISERRQLVCQLLDKCKMLCTERRQRLIGAKNTYEYVHEAEDFLSWIGEQFQAASVQELGRDYEHLLELRQKFDELRRRVESAAARFDQCDELAGKLAYSQQNVVDVGGLHDQLQQSWLQLLEALEARDERLSAAGDLHRFNRDVAEALHTVQAQKALAADDQMGRSLQAAQELLRRHEVFENELIALEAQLQVLVNDSARLQACYPSNGKHIAEQQRLLVSGWDQLHEQASERRRRLQQNVRLHRFLAAAHDLSTWAQHLISTMMTEVRVNDTACAQEVKAEHDSLKAEMEAREDSFTGLAQQADVMVGEGHYASTNIHERMQTLMELRTRLHSTWQERKVMLDQLIDLHFFFREAKLLDAASNQQKTTLSRSECGSDVNEVEAELRRQEALERLISVHNNKLTQLLEHGDKLLEQNHCCSAEIKERLRRCNEQRVQVNDVSIARRKSLEKALMKAQFSRDINEAHSWIDFKESQLSVERTSAEQSDLPSKIMRLKKHHAFQAELAAHEARINDIVDNGDRLIHHEPDNYQETRQSLDRLTCAWRHLMSESNACARGLEDAQDILEFNNEMEKLEAWIRDKEMLILSCDTGRDYEHCLSLQRRLDDVNSDMRVDDQRISKVNTLADKLVGHREDGQWCVQDRRQELNNRWRVLQDALTTYRCRLTAALRIHAFDRDVMDVTERIQEKVAHIVSADTIEVQDLKIALNLRRKQENLDRDVSAIDSRLVELKSEAQRLVEEQDDQVNHVDEVLLPAVDSWDQLRSLSVQRRNRLDSAYKLQKFKYDVQELEYWANEMKNKLNCATVSDESAQQLMHLHLERKAEIDGREESFKALINTGRRLVEEHNSACGSVKDCLANIETMKQGLCDIWEENRQKIHEKGQLQNYLCRVDQVNSWLATKEAVLNNDDLGDSIASVEKLIRKHNSFEETFNAQRFNVDDLEKLATGLVENNHRDAEAINDCLREVKSRYDTVLKSSSTRCSLLSDSCEYHHFRRSLCDVEHWLSDKMQIACDESYRDLTNLQSKHQKQQAFEAELQTNAGRVLASTSFGERLIASSHYASVDIQKNIDAVKSIWKQLQQQCSLKRSRLQEAHAALMFYRSLDELDSWIEETENVLASEDHGNSLAAVNILLKRHYLLKTDVKSHLDKAEEYRQVASQLMSAENFCGDELVNRSTQSANRIQDLLEPLQIRQDNLEEAKRMHQFYREVDDEIDWIESKRPLVESECLGESLSQVKGLLKDHQALENEISCHDAVLLSLKTTSEHMIKSGHFAAYDIGCQWNILNEKYVNIKDASSIRRLRLCDALDSHQYYAEVDETVKWLEDRYSLVFSQDNGNDLDACRSLFKSLSLIRHDMEDRCKVVTDLSARCQKLLDRNHFDGERIGERQRGLESIHSRFSSQLEARCNRLQQSTSLFNFLADAEEVSQWIYDQVSTSASEDYGKDVEHVQILINRFELFMKNLNVNQERIMKIRTSGNELIESEHPEPDRIKAKLDEIQRMWEDLNELTQARLDALQGAKQVHAFDHSADETISWIAEKQTQLSCDDYGQDTDAIQALIRRHQGLERDLAAIKEQIHQVIAESRRLADLFPDARDHISVKYEEAVAAWNNLLDMSAQRKNRLQQAAKIQEYFDEFRDLMAWINELLAKATSPQLASDVVAAESLIALHNEYKAEGSLRELVVKEFITRGRKLVDADHFMSADIEDKLQLLESRFIVLTHTLNDRAIIYTRSLDLLKFKRDALQLESWIDMRQAVLIDPAVGSSIEEVEDLIRQHDDFMKAVESQQSYVEALKRSTLLEDEFEKIKAREREEKAKELKRQEEEKLKQLKQKEIERIKNSRLGLNGDNGSVYSGLKDKIGSHSSLASLAREAGRSDSLSSGKPAKRAPSFTTRRRINSFRKTKHLDDYQNLPPVEIDGCLERKQELQNGGKKATIRSWRSFYTVLCGQLMCFFKDIDDFAASKAAAPPVVIYKALCEKAVDYTKKKFVLRLVLTDRSEYLFSCDSESQLNQWIDKINFHAHLSPSKQMLNCESSDISSNVSPPSVSQSASSVAQSEPIYMNVPVPPPRHPSTSLSSKRRSSITNSSSTNAEMAPQNRVGVVSSSQEGSVIEVTGHRISIPVSSFSSSDASLHKRPSSRQETPPPLPVSGPPVSLTTDSSRLSTGLVRQSASRISGSLPPGVHGLHDLDSVLRSAGNRSTIDHTHHHHRVSSKQHEHQGGSTISVRQDVVDYSGQAVCIADSHEQRHSNNRRNSVFGFLRRNKKDKQPAQV